MTDKKHIIQRWYEMSEKERINKRQVDLVTVAICLLFICIVLFIFTSPVDMSCTSGNIGLKANFKVNSSEYELTNLSINGVNGMSCHVKAPMFVIGGMLQ